MRLTVVGCSGSFPGPASPASCYLLQAEHEGRTFNLLLDLGSGALGALQRHVAPWDVDAVLLSHLHPDHCLDLCGLYVALTYRPGGAAPGHPALPVLGPAGTPERIARAYGAADSEGVCGPFDFGTLTHGVPVVLGPFTVTPYRVDHPVEAYGFRVEADGAVLAYTGDTDTCEALDPLCRNASLVLADSAFIDGRDDARGIHMSGRRAAEAALSAGAQRLMLTHLPSWNDPAVCRSQAAAVWPGDVELAEPGATYQL